MTGDTTRDRFHQHVAWLVGERARLEKDLIVLIDMLDQLPDLGPNRIPDHVLRRVTC